MTEAQFHADFPPATRDQWLARVAAQMKGAAGGDVPLFEQTAGPRAARPVRGPWRLVQRADHPDAARAGAQALEDLENGATGLCLVFAGDAGARGFGLAPEGLGRALDGVALHAVSLQCGGGNRGAQALARLVERQPLDPARLAISFAVDDGATAKDLAHRGFAGPFFTADGRPWHERGATAAEELGAVLALATGHLRAAESDSVPPAALCLAADQDMFGTLAKFRAIRLLWRRVREASGLAAGELPLHAETSWRMLATLDPHSNILRAAAAVFGAGLGGADAITVLPFSLAQGLPNGFARRIARNVQTLLLEEAHLWRVQDSASGSGYVEHLTGELCERAWAVFQAIEKTGSWPQPDPANLASLPVIGTETHRLAQEFEAAVDLLP